MINHLVKESAKSPCKEKMINCLAKGSAKSPCKEKMINRLVKGSTKSPFKEKMINCLVKGFAKSPCKETKTSLDTTESDSDDEEDALLDRFLALQEVMNPFRKICVWKKVVSFLGSLPVALQHVEWKPDYTGCFNKKEDSDGQWHAEIRLTDPYGNIYDHGFVTKKKSKKLAKYHKLSDIMSPNWFQI
ncbi:hypothetical protein Tco_0313572 [Tanacetum coccineum]